MKIGGAEKMKACHKKDQVFFSNSFKQNGWINIWHTKRRKKRRTEMENVDI